MADIATDPTRPIATDHAGTRTPRVRVRRTLAGGGRAVLAGMLLGATLFAAGMWTGGRFGLSDSVPPAVRGTAVATRGQSSSGHACRVACENSSGAAAFLPSGLPKRASDLRSSAGSAADSRGEDAEPRAATFSICARDPQTGELGVAVTTRVTQVGRLCPFTAAGVGAVSTQALVRVEYGPRALEFLKDGKAPADILPLLLKDDPQREERQLGIVAADGRTAVHTGSKCLDYAGHRVGPNFTVQGNLLSGPEVLDAIVASLTATAGSGFPLAERLLLALQAGQEAGGDKRRGRKQSAALVVSHPDRSFYGQQPLIQLHVAEHPEPVRELRRQYATIYQRLGYRPLALHTGRDVVELKVGLYELGLLKFGDTPLVEAVRAPGFPVFDTETAAAVDAFRRKHGLPTPSDGLGHSPGVVDEAFVRVFRQALARQRRAARNLPPAEPAPPPAPSN